MRIKTYQSRFMGFTLIELLVVISIIALLLSIMMPALNRAREMGRVVSCGSNLRQIGIGMRLYAADHNDNLPFFDLADRPRLQTSYWLNSVFYVWGKSGSNESNPRLLNNYIGTEVFHCPSDIPGKTLMFPNGIYAAGGNSYVYNSGILHDTEGSRNAKLFGPGRYGSPGIDVLWGLRFAQIRRPSHIVASGDLTMWYGMHFTAPSHSHVGYNQSLLHNRYRPMTNLLFVDGHVEYTLMREPPEHIVNPDYSMVLSGTSY